MIPEALDAFLQQQEKPRAVTRIEEKALAAIAGENSGITGAGTIRPR